MQTRKIVGLACMTLGIALIVPLLLVFAWIWLDRLDYVGFSYWIPWALGAMFIAGVAVFCGGVLLLRQRGTIWPLLAVVWAVMAADVLVFYGNESYARYFDTYGLGATNPAAADAVELVGLGLEVVLLLVLAICVWLTVRIIRRYRKAV